MLNNRMINNQVPSSRGAQLKVISQTFDAREEGPSPAATSSRHTRIFSNSS